MAIIKKTVEIEVNVNACDKCGVEIVGDIVKVVTSSGIESLYCPTCAGAEVPKKCTEIKSAAVKPVVIVEEV